MKLPLLRIVLISLVFTLTLTSCSESDEIEIPANVLSKEQFEKVLFDMSLAEAAININVKNARLEHMDSVYAFDVLRDNNISRGLYDTTLHFYSSHPELYKEVYDAVLQRISEYEVKSAATDTTKK